MRHQKRPGEEMKKKKVDFSSLDFDLDSIMPHDSKEDIEKEFIREARLNFEPVCFENAVKAAECIDINKDYFALVSGKFIFGDFIEALLYQKQLKPKRMYITTLGMSQENIDSIVNLTVLGAQEVNLIVSGYFAGTERRGLAPYMVKEFEGHNINVAVLASHCKLCLFECDEGNFMIAGSANLSSSNNVEQFQIFHDDKVFRHCKRMLNNILKKHTVIRGKTGETIFENNKDNIGSKAYQTVKEGMEDGE
jgi:hypothetical protein